MRLLSRVLPGRSKASSRRRRFGARGAAAVEFVLTAPILVTILVATVEFGNYFSQLGTMTAVAQDAVRFAAKQPTSVQARTMAVVAAEQILEDMGNLCATGTGCTLRGQMVGDNGIVYLQLSMSVPYRSVTGVIPDFYGPGIAKPQAFGVRATYPYVGSQILAN